MKHGSKYLPAFFSLIVLLCSFQLEGLAQKDKEKDVPIDSVMLDTARWVFTANQALPLRGRTIFLNDRYEVRYNTDTLIVSLPYYGRAFSGGYGDNKSPLDFTSTDFTMKKEQGKKESWIITIKPNDKQDIQSMQFTIRSKTSADLYVQFLNRDAINFRGGWEPKK